MNVIKKLKDLLPKEKNKEDLDQHYDNMKLEKGDLPAMLIAALITFLPVILIILAVVYGLIWLFALR